MQVRCIGSKTQRPPWLLKNPNKISKPWQPRSRQRREIPTKWRENEKRTRNLSVFIVRFAAELARERRERQRERESLLGEFPEEHTLFPSEPLKRLFLFPIFWFKSKNKNVLIFDLSILYRLFYRLRNQKCVHFSMQTPNINQKYARFSSQTPLIRTRISRFW